jgi:phosphatidylglycerophosphatase A
MTGRLALLFATSGYVGFLPKAPGTWGSITATLCFFAASRVVGIVPALHVSVCGLVTVLGAIAADRVARDRGVEDPQIVVIDEVAGQLIAFLFLAPTWQNLVAGTALFRLFDIWKPFPLRKAESLPHGVGIMADDVLAGIYANAILQVANRLFFA